MDTQTRQTVDTHTHTHAHTHLVRGSTSTRAAHCSALHVCIHASAHARTQPIDPNTDRKTDRQTQTPCNAARRALCLAGWSVGRSVDWQQILHTRGPFHASMSDQEGKTRYLKSTRSCRRGRHHHTHTGRQAGRQAQNETKQASIYCLKTDGWMDLSRLSRQTKQGKESWALSCQSVSTWSTP